MISMHVKRNNTAKRVLCFVCVIALFFSYVPVPAFGAENDEPPVANNDTISVNSTDESVLINVLKNDSSPNEEELVILSVATPTSLSTPSSLEGWTPGNVEIENNQICYTPNPRNKIGVTFTYTIGYKDVVDSPTATGTVTVNITDVNFIPIIKPEPNAEGYTIDEDEPLEFSFTVLDRDIGNILEDLQVSVSSDNQSVFAESGKTISSPTSLSIDEVRYTVTWQPAKDANTVKDDPVILTIHAKDGDGGEVSLSVAITVTPVPDAPIANDDKEYATSTVTSLLIDVLANDVSVDGGSLIILEVGTPTAGSMEPAGSAVVEDEKIRYTLDPRNKENVTFTYSIGYAGVEDSLEATGTVTVYITAANFIPEIRPEATSYTIDEDEPLEFTFTVYDRDTDDITSMDIVIESNNQEVFLDGVWTFKSTELISIDEVRYTVTWQPVKDANTTEHGAVSITITATDENDDASITCVLPITVNPLNDDPVITMTPEEDSYTIEEDTPLTITFTVTDVDPGDLAKLAFTITSDNQKIFEDGGYTLTLVSTVDSMATYSLTWMPEQDANTEKDDAVSLTILVEDGNGGEDSATIEITVTPVDDAPIAEDDEVYADSTEINIQIDVIDNDFSVDGYPLVILSVSTPTSITMEPAGSAVVENGKIKYTLDPRNKEDVTFTYTIGYEGVEDSLLIATATVTIHITDVNFIPEIMPEATSFTINEDETLSFTFTVYDRDIGDILTDLDVTITSGNQDVFMNGEFSIATPTSLDSDTVEFSVTWKPVKDANTKEYGPVNIIITATDEFGGVGECIIPITVNPMNDLPVLTQMGGEWRMNEDGTAFFKFRVYDVDTPNPLTEFKNITVASSNQNILKDTNITLSAPEKIDARTAEYTLTFKPEADQNTSLDLDAAVNGIIINVSLEDSDGGEASEEWELFINPVNDPPTAMNYSLTINEDEVVLFYVIADGIDVDILTNGDVLSIATFTSLTTNGGTVELVDPGNGNPAYLRYAPKKDYFGTDSFSYVICDEASEESIGHVNLTIIPVNDAPVFIGLPDTITVLEDDIEANLSFVFFVDDAETNADSLMVQAASLNTGKISSVLVEHNIVGGERVLVLHLVANQNTTKGGPVTIRLVVSDTDLTTTQYIEVNITAVNDPPVARNITYNYNEDTPLPISITDILSNVTDVDVATDDDVVSFVNFTSLSEGTLVRDGDTLLFTPVPDSEKNVTFTYIVEDKSGAQATATITLNCIPVNDPPWMDDILPKSPATAFSVDEDDSITIPIKFHDPETLNKDLIIIVTASDSSVVNLYSTVVKDFTVDGGNLVITPIHDKNTKDAPPLLVTVTISDGINSVYKTFYLEVHPMPDAPVAVNDLYSDRAGNTLTFNPLDNDYDVDDGEIISMYSITEPGEEQGTLSLLEDGSGRYVFIADEDFTGDVILHYYIIDNSKDDDPENAIRDDFDNPIGLKSNEGTITINVTEQSSGPSLRALGGIVTFVGNVVDDLELTVRNIPSGNPYNLSVVSSNTAVISVMDIAGMGPEANALTGGTQPLKLTAKAPGETLITVTLEYGAIIDSISFYVTVSAFNNPPTTEDTYGDVEEGVYQAWFDVLENCNDVEKPVNLKLLEILPPESGSYHATVSIVEHDGKQQIQYEVIGAKYDQLYWNGTDEINYRIIDGGGATADGKLFVTRLEMDNAPVGQMDIFYVEYSEISAGKTFDPLYNDYDRDDQYGAHIGQSLSEKGRLYIYSITPVAGSPEVEIALDGKTFTFPAEDPHAEPPVLIEPGWYDYTYIAKNTGWSGIEQSTSPTTTIWIGVKDEDGVVPPRVTSRSHEFNEDTYVNTPFTDNAAGSIHAENPYAGSDITNYKLTIEITAITLTLSSAYPSSSQHIEDIIDFTKAANKTFGVDIIGDTTFQLNALPDAYGRFVITWRAVLTYDKDGVSLVEPKYSGTTTNTIHILPVNDPPELSIATDDLASADVTVIDPVAKGYYRNEDNIDDVDLSIYVLRSETAKIPLYVDDVDLNFSNAAEIAKGLTFSWKNSEEINIPVETNVHVYLDEVNHPGDNHYYILEITPIRSEQEPEYNPAYLTVTVSDGFETDSVLIEVYVEPKNTPPFAREHTVTTYEDMRISIPVVIASGADNLVSDIDRDNLTIVISNTAIDGKIPEDGWPRDLGLFQVQLVDGVPKEVPVGPERGTITVAGRNIVFQPAENYNNWDDDLGDHGDWTDTPLLIYFMLHDGQAFSTEVIDLADLEKYDLENLTYHGEVGVVNIKIIAENDPPDIYGLLGDYTMLEDEADFYITFHARDVDGDELDEDSFTVTFIDDYGHIKFAKVESIVHELDGSYTCKLHIETKQDQFCTDLEPPHVITITVTDHELESSVSFNLSITPVNDGIVLLHVEEQATNGVPAPDQQTNEENFFFIRNEDTQLVIDFENYFKDIDGDDIKITALGTATHGTLVRTSDTVITFTPASNFNSFEAWSGDTLTRKALAELVYGDYAWMTLTLSDPYGDAHVVTVQIQINPVNDSPVANAFTVNVDEDPENPITITPFVSGRVSDIDNMLDELTLTAVGTTAHGTVTWNSGARSFDYMPNPDWNGTDTVSYTVFDGQYYSSNIISIVVTSVHDEPRISFEGNDGYFGKPSTPDDVLKITFDEDLTGKFMIHIWTPEAVNLLLKIIPYTLNGGAPYQNIITPDGVKFSGSTDFCEVTVTPLPNQFGVFGLEFWLDDGVADTVVRYVTVTVNPINDKPVLAGTDTFTMLEDTSVGGSLSATDVETAAANMLYSIKEAPKNGTLVLDSQTVSGSALVCTWTYTPDLDWYGTETFVIEVEDDNSTDFNDYDDLSTPVPGRTDKVITVTVTPVNDTPTAPTDVSLDKTQYGGGDTATLSFTAGEDHWGETPRADLTYDIDVSYDNGVSWTRIATDYNPAENEGLGGSFKYTYTITADNKDTTGLLARVRTHDTVNATWGSPTLSETLYSGYTTTSAASVDSTNPTVSAAQSPTTDTNLDVIITLTIADPGTGASGIDTVVSDDDLDEGTGTGYTFIAEVNGTYKFTVTDKVGHTAAASIIITNIDKLNPIVSADIATITSLDNKYANSGETVTLTYVDQPGTSDYKMSGVVLSQYVLSLDGTAPASGAASWLEYTVPIELDTKGTWYIHAKVRDNAGNEVIDTFGPYIIKNSAPVAIDGSVNVTEHASTAFPNGNKVTVDLRIYVSDVDAADVLTYTVVTYPGSLYGTWTATSTAGVYEFVHSGYGVLPFEDKLYVTFYAKDSDDEVSATKTVTINVQEVNDKPSVPEDVDPEEDYYKDGDVVELVWTESSDEETATADLKYEIEVSFNGGTWTTVETTDAGDTDYDYTVSSGGANGTMQLRIRALDNHATLPPERSDWALSPIYSLDNANPTVSAVQSPTADTNGNVTITLTVTDPEEGASGIASVMSDDGLAQGTGYTFTATKNGTYTFTVKDKVGHTATESIAITNIDKLDPGVSVDIDEIEATEDKYADSDVEIELTYIDQPATGDYKMSGVTLRQYVLSQDDTVPASGATSWTNYGGPIALNTKGTWYIHAKVRDNAGNEVIETFGPYVINNSAPVAIDGSVNVTEHASMALPNANRVTVDLRSYVSDVDAADELTITVDTYPDSKYGTWTATATLGVYEFVHSGYGVLPFTDKLYVTFYATDSDSELSDIKTVTINVQEVNDKPSTPTGVGPEEDYYKDGDVVELVWTESSDEETATADLVYEIEVSFNEGSWTAVTTTGTGATDYNYAVASSGVNGTMQLRIRALDNHLTLPVERSDWALSPIYSLDNADPTVSAAQNPTSDTNGNVTITLTITDPEAGASGIDTVVSDDDLDEGTAPDTFIVDVNGTYSFTVTDNVGHTARTSISITNIDKLDPIVSADIATITSLDNKYANSGATVTLTYVDQPATGDYKMSGVDISQYVLSLDGTAPASGATSWTNYGGPIALNTKGTWYIHAKVCDNAGNEVIETFGPYVINNSAPVATDGSVYVTEHASTALPNANRVTVDLRNYVTDVDVSDVLTYTVVTYPDSLYGTWTATATPGVYEFVHSGYGVLPFVDELYVTFYAKDSDGEVSATKTVTISVTEVNDKPSTPTGVDPATDYYKDGDVVELSWMASTDEETATTDLKYEIEVSFNGGSWTTVATTGTGDTDYDYSVSSSGANGNMQLRIRALDNHATLPEERSDWALSPIYSLDNANPTVSAVQSPMADTNGDVTITLTIADSGAGASGIDTVVSDDGLTPGSGANTFTATTNGTYTFTVTDNVGHAATATITISNIDKLPPKPVAATSSGGLTDWDGYEISHEITVTLTYEDADATTAYKSSVITTSQYLLIQSSSGPPAIPGSDAAWRGYTVPVVIGTRGIWYLYGRAIDNVGNETITYLGVYTITIDPLLPYAATLTVRKDNAVWPGHGKTFTLKLSSDETKTANISSGSVSVVSGEWKIYDGAEYTGTNIIIDGGAGSASLDYYSVTFTAVPAGMATGANIDASNGMSSGEALLTGTAVTLTASGATPMEYSYLWTGAGANSETTPDLSLTVTSTVDVECTVTGLYNAIIHVFRDRVLWGDRIVELYDGITRTTILMESGLHTSEYSAQVMNGTYYIYVDRINTGATITVYDADAEVTLDYYSLILHRETGVSVVTGNGAYLAGKTVNISAMLYSGYEWDKWDDSVSPGFGEVTERNASIIMPDHLLILTANAKTIPDIEPETYTVTVIVLQEESGEETPLPDVNVEIPGEGSGATDSDGYVVLSDISPGYHVLLLSGQLSPLLSDYSSSFAVYGNLTVTIVLPIDGSIKGGHLFSEFSHEENVRVDNQDLHEVYEAAKNEDNTNDALGVTVYDLVYYDDGGDITIFLIANEVDESFQQTEIDAIQDEIDADDKDDSFMLDLSAYIRVVDNQGDLKREMQLDELNGIVRVYVTLAPEHQGHIDYAVYRYHDAGIPDPLQPVQPAQNVQKIPEGEDNKIDGEYFEISPDGKVITLFVKKFSVYAVAYNFKPPSSSGASASDKSGAVPEIDPPMLNTIDHFAYIFGYPDGRVRPEGNITREEVATIFFRLLKDEIRDENLSSINDFSDVGGNRWSNNAISTLAKLGILLGYPDGEFKPGKTITRAEFVAIAARFLDVINDKGDMPYSDVSVDHWAAKYIMGAYNVGLVMGFPDGTFRPEAPISRAEAVAIINRLLNRHVESTDDLLPDTVKWSDNANPDEWYYFDIQEATNSHDYSRKEDGRNEKWEGLLPNIDRATFERIRQ